MLWTGKAELCGEPCIAKEMHVNTRVISYVQYLSKKHQYLKNKREKEKKKANEKKKTKRKAFLGSNSRPQTQSKLHSSSISTGGLIFIEKKYRITQGTRTRDTLHTARSAPKTWVKIYSKPVPAQGTQNYGRPCRFQQNTYEWAKNAQNLKKIELKRTPHTLLLFHLPSDMCLNRLIHSRREKKTLSARHTRHVARIAPKSRRLRPDGLPLSTFAPSCANGARTKRYEYTCCLLKQQYGRGALKQHYGRGALKQQYGRGALKQQYGRGACNEKDGARRLCGDRAETQSIPLQVCLLS